MNDPVGADEEDSISRKLFERTESLLGRFHTSKKPSTGSREGSPESLLGRFHSKQKEKPSCKRQKTEPSPKIQGLTSPPKMQGMTSPRLKREGSKRKTKVAEDIFDQIFAFNEIGSVVHIMMILNELIMMLIDDDNHYDDLQVFSYNTMGRVVHLAVDGYDHNDHTDVVDDDDYH